MFSGHVKGEGVTVHHAKSDRVAWTVRFESGSLSGGVARDVPYSFT